MKAKGIAGRRCSGNWIVRLLCLFFLAGILLSQDPSVSSHLFQKAANAELVQGDLELAIQLYNQILTTYGNDREVAARALFHLATCHEKLGRVQAVDLYRRLLREYSDQGALVERARMRLSKLESDSRSGQTLSKQGSLQPVLDGLRPLPHKFPYTYEKRIFDFSPSGDQVVFHSTFEWKGRVRRGISISDAGGARRRPFAADFDSYAAATYPRWSPDGNSIAYLATSSDGKQSILLADLKSDNHRRLVSLVGSVRDLTWSADGQELLVMQGRASIKERPTQPALTPGLHEVDLRGNLRLIQAMPVPAGLSLGGVSSDGKWVAFSAPSRTEEQLEVWVMPSSGGRARQVTWDPGIDAHPTWGPKADELYFVSSRNGDPDLFLLKIDSETGVPEGEPVQLTSFDDAKVLIPHFVGKTNEIAYTLLKTTSTVHLVEGNDPRHSRELVRGHLARISADGRTVFYIPEGPGKEGIYSIPVSGGKPRQLTKKASPAIYGPGFDVSPDGKTLAFLDKVENGFALRTMSTEGGGTKKIAEIETQESDNGPHPEWSPDGRWITFSADDALYKIPGDGSAPAKIIGKLWKWQSATARWSPDGTQIAALGYEQPGQWIAVWAVPATGGEPRRLTTEEGYKEGLTWHPDGSRLSYMVYKPSPLPSCCPSEIRNAYLDGRESDLLLDSSDYWDYVPAWDPSGEALFYIASPWTSYAWTLLSWNSKTKEHEVVFEADKIELPVWSRDGNRMVFSETRETYQLWVQTLEPR